MQLLLVLLGGGIGSAARYLTGVWITERLGAAFPWGTLVVNVVGSFLIGLIATLADERDRLGPDLRLFLVGGVLGGFTTFSAFSLETLRLLDGRQPLRAVLNVLGSVVLGFAAAALGIAVGRR